MFCHKAHEPFFAVQFFIVVHGFGHAVGEQQAGFTVGQPVEEQLVFLVGHNPYQGTA